MTNSKISISTVRIIFNSGIQMVLVPLTSMLSAVLMLMLMLMLAKTMKRDQACGRSPTMLKLRSQKVSQLILLLLLIDGQVEFFIQDIYDPDSPVVIKQNASIYLTRSYLKSQSGPIFSC